MNASPGLNIPVDDDILHIPFLVNVNGMTTGQIDALMDLLHNDLGAQYYREKSLLWEVLDDRINAAQRPQAFLYGPFLKVAVKHDGTLRLTSADRPEGGDTVYSVDQVQALVAGLRKEESPRPPRPNGG